MYFIIKRIIRIPIANNPIILRFFFSWISSDTVTFIFIVALFRYRKKSIRKRKNMEYRKLGKTGLDVSEK